jgi:hypothetical protein
MMKGHLLVFLKKKPKTHVELITVTVFRVA